MSTDEQKDIAPDASQSAAGAEQVPDLDADALAAAAAAIAKGERALRELPDDVLSNRVGDGRPRRREKILRAVLFLNLILMGVMVALPDPEAAAPEPTDAGTSSSGNPPPEPPQHTVDPDPEPQPRTRPEPSNLWSRGFLLLGEERYDEAAEALLDFERLNPQLLPGKRLDLYTAISSCLFKAGRLEEAARYREKTNRLISGGSLPEDLRNAARAAWDGARYEEARRYYSRFLLQQRQLSPAMRETVAEAYLRIGDSYRKAAELGQEGKK